MASLLPEIPLKYFNPTMKYALINWLVDLGLPARIMRGIMNDWAKALDVTLTAGDYQLIENHLKVSLGPNAPPGLNPLG